MKCIKCNTEDSRINGQDKVLCSECLANLPQAPDEKINFNWDEIEEKW